MSYTIEQLPGEPIVLVTFANPFDIRTDIPLFVEELRAIFDASPEPLIDITDTRGLKIAFGDIVAGMAMLTRGTMSVLNHPNVARYIIVADSDLIRVAGQALGQRQYGNLRVSVVKDPGEAQRLAREAVAQYTDPA
jgi:hypothetical protein